MIRRGRGLRYSAAAWGQGDDTESLHTDVMRFMAILGLCLTAIFALVQSISVREPEHRSEELHDDALKRNTVLMEENARDLQPELDRLTAEIKETRESRDIATQALASAQEQLTVINDDIVQKSDKRDRVKVELAALTLELQERRRELDRIRQVSREKSDTLAGLSRRLDQERKKLDRVDEPVKAVKLRPAIAPMQSASEEHKISRVESTEQGFTLRFASVEALDQLVEDGKVSLYGMSGEYAWRLSLGSGNPAFVRAVFPRRFYEMAMDTVPARYVGAFTKSTPDSGQTPVVWGVKLPSETERRIASLTRRLTGGTLVIGPDGRVETEADRTRE